MTGYMPLMWSIWAVLLGLLLVLYAYRIKITRDEDDQIVLDDSFDNVRAEQAAIVEKVHKLDPFFKLMWGLEGVMSLAILGNYVVFILKQLQFI